MIRDSYAYFGLPLAFAGMCALHHDRPRPGAPAAQSPIALACSNWCTGFDLEQRKRFLDKMHFSAHFNDRRP
jgi:hypothetical protein